MHWIWILFILCLGLWATTMALPLHMDLGFLVLHLCPPFNLLCKFVFIYSLRPIITEPFSKKKCPKITEPFHFPININYFFPFITLINITFIISNINAPILNKNI